MSRSVSPEPLLRRRYLVVAYDVQADRRRARVARTLEDFGVRVQYSVFECLLTPAQQLELVAAINAAIDETEDSVSVYPLSPGARSRTLRLGRAPPAPDPPYLIL